MKRIPAMRKGGKSASAWQNEFVSAGWRPAHVSAYSSYSESVSDRM